MPRRLLHLDVSVPGLLVLLGIGLGIWLLTLLRTLVLLILVATLFAAALHPAVDWLVRWRVPRALAVVLVMLLIVLALALVPLLVGPIFVHQGQALAHRLPGLRQDVVRLLEQRGLHDVAVRLQSFTPGRIEEPVRLLGGGRLILSGITASVTALVLTAYLLLDAPRILHFLDFATPERYHTHLHRLLAALGEVVGGYIRGQVLTSIAATAFAFALFTILRLPDALALAVFGGIMDIVPIIGIYLFVVPSAIVGFTKSVPAGIIVAVLLFAYQEFESRVLVQRIYGKTLRLPAIVVVVALLAGAELEGIVGALLALPAAGAIRVLIDYGAAVRREQALRRPPTMVRAPSPADDERTRSKT